MIGDDSAHLRHPESCWTSWLWLKMLYFTTMVSIVVFTFESVRCLLHEFATWFYWLELFFLVVFSFEQAVYFVALAYGWWCWTHPGDRTRLPVTTLAGGHRATLVLGGLLITAIWGALLVEIGDPMPWRDAFIASFGVIAQWLEAHKKLEAWIGWMAVNIAGIGVYAAIGLYWFVGLYGLYLVLSFTGFWRWQADRARSLEQA